MAHWIIKPEEHTYINLDNYDPEAFLFSLTTDYPQYNAVCTFAFVVGPSFFDMFSVDVPNVSEVVTYNLTNFVTSKLKEGETVGFYYLFEDVWNYEINSELNTPFEGEFTVTAYRGEAPPIDPDDPPIDPDDPPIDPDDPPIVNVSSKNLAGNPVFVEYNNNSLPVTLVIMKADNSEIIHLQAIPDSAGKIRWNIADILEAYIDQSPFPDMDTDLQRRSPFIYNLKFEISGQTVLTQTNRIAFGGGIPNGIFRKLAAAGTNIFAAKLQNYTTNCFLTTRSNSEKITMPATEAGYLYMIGDDSEHTLTITAATGESGDLTIPAGIAINAINFASIVIVQPGIYTVAIDGVQVLAVELTEPTGSRERYLLNFRNSYGVYEQLEVTGRAVSEPEYAEENVYSIYDSITDSLRNEKFRREVTEVIKVECGYRSRERLMFVRDMLQSEDVRLLGADGEWINVLVSTESDTVPKLLTEPVSIPLVIKFAEADSRHTPDEQVSPDIPSQTLLTYDDGLFIELDDGALVEVD